MFRWGDVMFRSIGTLLLVVASVCSVYAGSSDFELGFAIPKVLTNGPNGPTAHVVTYDTADKHPVYVLLTNKSSKEQRLWEDWNSWGYRNLSIEFSDSTGKTWLAKKGIAAWTYNGPTWFSLAPGETHVFTITFPDNWKNLPKVDGSPAVVTLRAIYEITPDPDPKIRSIGVWAGKVMSNPVKVEIYNPK
jgi:hypothetical protein